MVWPAIGVFVGGRGLRMGGVAKGLLQHEGVPLIERVLGACRAAAAPAPLQHVYLVGDAAAYTGVGLPRLDDAPPGIGPIGGLRSLLLCARELGVDAVALAVDLPYLGGGLVRRVCLEQPGAAALAPRQDERWQPLFARYRPELVLPAVDVALASGQTALQAIFQRLIAGRPSGSGELGSAGRWRPAEPAGSGLAVAELALTPAEERELRDWDSPSDMGTAVRTG